MKVSDGETIPLDPIDPLDEMVARDMVEEAVEGRDMLSMPYCDSTSLTTP